MRAWVYPEKQYQELGAERWEVEWQEVSPAALKRQEQDDSYEIDLDVDLLTFRKFYKTEAKALEGARYWYKKRSDWLAFGSMIVTKQVVDWYVEEDRVAHWEYVGEPTHVD